MAGIDNPIEFKRAIEHKTFQCTKAARSLEAVGHTGKPVRKSEVLGEMGFGEGAVRGLIEKGIIVEKAEIVNRSAYEDDLEGERVDSEWELTEEQKNASDDLTALLKENKFAVQLLHGVTGSGKTEVYFEAMQTALDQGGGVLFLVPVVSLAPQTVSKIAG